MRRVPPLRLVSFCRRRSSGRLASFWLPVEVNSIRPELSTAPKLACVAGSPDRCATAAFPARRQLRGGRDAGLGDRDRHAGRDAGLLRAVGPSRSTSWRRVCQSPLAPCWPHRWLGRARRRHGKGERGRAGDQEGSCKGAGQRKNLSRYSERAKFYIKA